MHKIPSDYTLKPPPPTNLLNKGWYFFGKKNLNMYIYFLNLDYISIGMYN